MIYGYCRVSTPAQAAKGNSLDDQASEILARYPDAEIITESASGAKTRKEFSRLLDSSVAGDTIVVTKLDRFCRTTKEGLGHIERLQAKGVNVHILNMGLVEDSPMGTLIITCLLAFAEFERSQILERTQAGKVVARKNPGYREGRPKKYTPTQIKHALDLLQDHSYRQVEAMTGISTSTLVRSKKTNKL